MGWAFLWAEGMVGDEVWACCGGRCLFDPPCGAPAGGSAGKIPQFCSMRTSARFMFMAVATNRRWQALRASPR